MGTQNSGKLFQILGVFVVKLHGKSIGGGKFLYDHSFLKIWYDLGTT